LLVVAGIALSALGAQAQNLVTNGSFEDIVNGAEITGPSGSGWNTYSEIDGWTGQPNIEVRVNTAGTTPFGTNFVELDTTANSKMFQDIEITTAGEYLLSFFYSARPNVSSTTTLGVNNNALSFAFGALGGNVLEGISGGVSHNWMQYSDKQYLAVGHYTLTFGAEGYSNSYGGSLDNVSVTAVPEAETYAMMLAGLGLMGSIVRRRKAKNA